MTKKFYTAYFSFSGCEAAPVLKTNYAPTLEAIANEVTLEVPEGMNDVPVDYQDYRQDKSAMALELPTPTGSERVLDRVKYPYRILVPHQYLEYLAQDSFFLQDQRRTFLARQTGTKLREVVDPKKLELGDILRIAELIPYEDPRVGPAVDPVRDDRGTTISLSDLHGQIVLGVAQGSGR